MRDYGAVTRTPSIEQLDGVLDKTLGREQIQPVHSDGTWRPGPPRSIEAIHALAIPHRGIWMHVLTPAAEILVVTRAQQLKTCPGKLSTIGEHNLRAESAERCARRAILEELSVLLPHAPAPIPLRAAPRWFNFDYEDGRRDRSLISEFLLQLPLNSSAALALLRGSRRDGANEQEASRFEFMPLHEMYGRLRKQPKTFCAAPLFARCLLDSVRDTCAFLRRSRAHGCKGVGPPRQSAAMSTRFDAMPVVRALPP